MVYEGSQQGFLLHTKSSIAMPCISPEIRSLGAGPPVFSGVSSSLGALSFAGGGRDFPQPEAFPPRGLLFAPAAESVSCSRKSSGWALTSPTSPKHREFTTNSAIRSAQLSPPKTCRAPLHLLLLPFNPRALPGLGIPLKSPGAAGREK